MNVKIEHMGFNMILELEQKDGFAVGPLNVIEIYIDNADHIPCDTNVVELLINSKEFDSIYEKALEQYYKKIGC